MVPNSLKAYTMHDVFKPTKRRSFLPILDYLSLIEFVEDFSFNL